MALITCRKSESFSSGIGLSMHEMAGGRTVAPGSELPVFASGPRGGAVDSTLPGSELPVIGRGPRGGTRWAESWDDGDSSPLGRERASAT